ncbi:hypothetical protein FRB90_010797, partial [Tulasnella sp. 427]
NVYFPPPCNVATAAIKLSGVTSFWDIANRFEVDVPWGVTGNLVVRRRVRDEVSFDLRFPKTGGGEDIDFCLRKKRWSWENGGEGLYGAPDMRAVHPWWNDGGRIYGRFFVWAKGDGALMAMHPQFTYTAAAPNGGELVVVCLSLTFISAALAPFLNSALTISTVSVQGALAAIVVNVAYTLYGYCIWGSEETAASLSRALSPHARLLAVAENASLSFARTHIKSGDSVLLRLPSGDYRNLKVYDKPGRITLGKFGSFLQNQLVGHPYGLSYDILAEGKISVRKAETMTELEDTSATNELINDGNFVQPLTYEEIETLKKTPGVHSSEIIKMQIAQNANYELKSEYSKEKYKKRKEAKFV